MQKAFFGLLVCSLATSPLTGFSQIRNFGTLKISAVTALISSDVFKNEPAATSQNNGTLVVPENFTNLAGATANGNGLYKIGLNWLNNGTFTADSSTVLFEGQSPGSVTSGGSPFFNLSMNKEGQNLFLTDAMQINGNLDFVLNNELIEIGTHNLTFGPTASITGFGQNQYIVTASTGRVVKENMAAGSSFLFPVGFSTAGFQYNPLTLTQGAGAVVDALGVRCLEHAFENGLTGPALSEGVADVSWDVTENTPGGNNLTVLAGWWGPDELLHFFSNDCGIARFSSGADWDLPPARMGAATGIGPIFRSGSGILSVGVFAVASERLMDRVLVSLKIFLQGAGYDAVNQRQGDVLRAAGLIPFSMPTTYTSGKFAPVGWQPPVVFEVDPAVLLTTGNDAIVDWVFVFLKNPTSPFATVQTRPALVQRDGDVVDLDGVSPVEIPGSAGSWLVGIGHRNHLSIRTPNANPLTLNELTTTNYNFTTALAQAYGTNPMKQIASNPAVFGLWAGNANVNLNSRYSGPANDNGYILNTCLNGMPGAVLTNQYSNCDLNMNGVVRYSGPNNDSGYLLNSVLGGILGGVITEQF